MANEIKEIGDVVKKCKILLLDIEGTTTAISFVKVGPTADRPAFLLSNVITDLIHYICISYLVSLF